MMLNNQIKTLIELEKANQSLYQVIELLERTHAFLGDTHSDVLARSVFDEWVQCLYDARRAISKPRAEIVTLIRQLEGYDPQAHEKTSPAKTRTATCS